MLRATFTLHQRYDLPIKLDKTTFQCPCSKEAIS